MKKTIIITIALLFLALPFHNIASAQFEALLDIDVSSCSSAGGCEVVTRQYTGLATFYRINVRCMDSSGNFGSWDSWEYNGIYPGSACNGEI